MFWRDKWCSQYQYTTGGTAGYSYNWTPDIPTEDGTTSVTGLTAQTCTVTDANSCNAFQTFSITSPTAISTTPSQTNVSCSGGSNGTATVSASGGTPSYSYSWAPSGGTGAAASGLAAGTYTCTVTDANGCSPTASVSLTEPLLIAITSAVPSAPTFCGSADGSLAFVTTNLPNGNYTFNYKQASVSKTATVTANNNTFSLLNLSAGLYSDLTILSGTCQGVFNGTVSLENPPLVITASNSGPYEEGSTIHLIASGGISYSWSGPNGVFSTLPNPSIIASKPENAGVYTVTVSNGICAATATTSVAIDCNNPHMSYYLAYSGTHPEIIAPISNNLEVQYSPTRPMTIIAVTSCELPKVESVKLQLSGSSNVHYYEDNEMPFALHEVGQVMNGDILIPNLYTFIARGYSQDNAQGTVLVGPETYQFWIVNENTSIAAPAIPTGPLCVEASFTVSTTAAGAYNPGNVFQAYISDENGNFSNLLVVGTSTDPTNIACTLPNYLKGGNGYKVKVVSTAPVVSSTLPVSSLEIIATDVHLSSPNQDVLSNNRIQKAGNTIRASNKINENSNVQYISGRYQTLEPGFEVQAGGVFMASIETVCPN